MHPTQTFELRVTCGGEPRQAAKTKQRLTEWLLMNGVESFVEGALDVDYNHEYGEPERDFYGEFGGDAAPVSIYRYSRESLEDLQAKLLREFGGGSVTVELHVMATETWMEGWKESFRPFSTEKFYVAPPWVKEEAPKGLIPVIIEPGMAFGTGQHATTRLCLDQLGKIVKGQKVEGVGGLAGQRVLDVGTGTGILAIGAKLLGYGVCAGTDIDDDAVAAAVENAKVNKAEVYLRKGSIPEGEYDLVFANILAVVLLRIMGDLAGVVRKGGGKLVLSGILVEEEQELVESAVAQGLRLVDTGRQDGWACLVVERV